MPKTFKIDPCWFGERKVVYVRVELPSHKDRASTAHFVVYGHSVDKVADKVFSALAREFGWHGGGHPRVGRTPKKKLAQKR
jgi:hypothetical protein